MRFIKRLFIFFGLLSFYFGTSQEKTSLQLKSTEIIEYENRSKKNTPVKRIVTLRAISIDPSKEEEKKIKKVIILDTIKTKRINNRKQVYLSTKPIGETTSEVRKLIQFEDGPQQTKNRKKVELNAILFPSEE